MYIYKVMSLQDWEESKTIGYLKPLPLDTTFMHLCSKEQITMIVEKFWQHETNIIVAEIDPNMVIGNLIHEANPGGSNKYYHLYNGSIPLQAVIRAIQYESIEPS